jgi:hypothetical protein
MGSGLFTVGTVTTQNNNINMGSGLLTVGTVTTQNSNINMGTGLLTVGTINTQSASGLFSRSTVIVNSSSQTIAALNTFTSIGTLASQTTAAGSAWRIKAFGTYTAISSANVRNLTIAMYWGTTPFTQITTAAVLANTAQSTTWYADIMLVGANTTQIKVTGVLTHQVDSTTKVTQTLLNLAGANVTAGPQTTDFRIGQTGTTATGDTIVTQTVFIERIN